MKAKPNGNAQEVWFEDEEDGFMAERATSAEIQENKSHPEFRRWVASKKVSLPEASAARQSRATPFGRQLASSGRRQSDSHASYTTGSDVRKNFSVPVRMTTRIDHDTIEDSILKQKG